MDRQTSSLHNWIANITGFLDLVVSITLSQIHYCRAKADSVHIDRKMLGPITVFLQNGWPARLGQQTEIVLSLIYMKGVSQHGFGSK